mmetsp:Transcript_10727/g.27543  ORF Transcript_10727/g.27543 Transcript_10727/m.27543 type:complete len:81 (-) Transcript_10727:923-1165(-)
MNERLSFCVDAFSVGKLCCAAVAHVFWFHRYKRSLFRYHLALCTLCMRLERVRQAQHACDLHAAKWLKWLEIKDGIQSVH